MTVCHRIVNSVKSSSCPIWSCLRAVLVILFGRTIQHSIAITESTNNLEPIAYEYNIYESHFLVVRYAEPFWPSNPTWLGNAKKTTKNVIEFITIIIVYNGLTEASERSGMFKFKRALDN